MYDRMKFIMKTKQTMFESETNQYQWICHEVIITCTYLLMLTSSTKCGSKTSMDDNSLLVHSNITTDCV